MVEAYRALKSNWLFLMKRVRRTRLTLNRFLPWLTLLCSILLFGLHFFLGGGRTKLINDSRAYLVMTEGNRAGTPFDSRVLAPFIASLITFASGASSLTAFHVLTITSFIASLLLLRKIVANRGAPVYWQAGVLLAIGCALAATFGDVPVMADLPLLVLTCLTVLAVGRSEWFRVLVFSFLAALTKEYGILLAVISSVIFWRRGHKRLAVAGTLLPTVVLLFTILMGSKSSGSTPDAWHNFINAMLAYHPYLFHFRGPWEYLQLLYMWSWSVLWPVLIIAALIVFSRLQSGTRMSDHEIGLALMLIALPFLLLGDWGRAVLIVVPFACAVATSHSLARSRQFAALLAIGGLSTALARPFHSETPPPHLLMLSFAAISLVSTVFIGMKILRFVASTSSPQIKRALDTPETEVAV